MNQNHIIWHNGFVSRIDRNHLNNHKSGVVWFTGLSFLQSCERESRDLPASQLARLIAYKFTSFFPSIKSVRASTAVVPTLDSERGQGCVSVAVIPAGSKRESILDSFSSPIGFGKGQDAGLPAKDLLDQEQRKLNCIFRCDFDIIFPRIIVYVYSNKT